MISSVEQLVDALSTGCWPEFDVKVFDSEHGLLFTLEEVSHSHQHGRTLLVVRRTPASLSEVAQMVEEVSSG